MTPYDIPIEFMLFSVFILGCVLGSFLNVCVYRFPQHDTLARQLRSIWSPRSACPNCATPILPRDNIPVLGWILLSGRCRNCRSRISIRYPVVELANGLLFALVYWLEIPADRLATVAESSGFSVYGPQLQRGLSQTALLNWRYVYHMILIEALVVASLIDWDLKIIPDGATVPAMILGVLLGGAVGQVYLVPVWFQHPQAAQLWNALLPGIGDFMDASVIPAWISAFPHLHGLAVSVVGLLVGGGLVWGVRLIGHRVLKREAMGFGDVILMALIGSFLGWQPALVAFFLAPIAALLVVAVGLVVSRPRVIPYGPYLSLAAVCVMLSWNKLGGYFENIFQQGPLVPLMAIVMAAALYVTLHMMQFIKRLLGIPLYPEPEWEERWTSADQLLHFSGEQVDVQQGQWPVPMWPGVLAARGQGQEAEWRGGDASGLAGRCGGGYPMSGGCEQHEVSN